MRAYIVTGCSRGLGLELTRHLLRTTVQVVGIARQAPIGLEDETTRGHFSFIQADLADTLALDDLMTRALAALGAGPFERLSLINNAGVVIPIAQTGDYPAEQVIQALSVNLTAPILLANALLRQARDLSCALDILNISSGAAVTPYPGWGVYGASKAALDHFSRHVALEQSGHARPARIVALYPGVVDTGMQGEIRASDARAFPHKPRFDALKREGGLSSAQDAARRILDYLDSDDFGVLPVVDIRSLSLSQTKP